MKSSAATSHKLSIAFLCCLSLYCIYSFHSCICPISILHKLVNHTSHELFLLQFILTHSQYSVLLVPSIGNATIDRTISHYHFHLDLLKSAEPSTYIRREGNPWPASKTKGLAKLWQSLHNALSFQFPYQEHPHRVDDIPTCHYRPWPCWPCTCLRCLDLQHRSA